MAKKKTPKIDEKELSENLSNLGQMGEEFHTPTDKFNQENEVVLELSLIHI